MAGAPDQGATRIGPIRRSGPDPEILLRVRSNP
jgi:hypothetical protein